jgi:hypothetical protein
MGEMTELKQTIKSLLISKESLIRNYRLSSSNLPSIFYPGIFGRVKGFSTKFNRVPFHTGGHGNHERSLFILIAHDINTH